MMGSFRELFYLLVWIYFYSAIQSKKRSRDGIKKQNISYAINIIHTKKQWFISTTYCIYHVYIKAIKSYVYVLCVMCLYIQFYTESYFHYMQWPNINSLTEWTSVAPSYHTCQEFRIYRLYPRNTINNLLSGHAI